MTDRHAGYIVVLAEDIREDDAEGTLNALRMVRGVISVTPVISDHTQAVARDVRQPAGTCPARPPRARRDVPGGMPRLVPA